MKTINEIKKEIRTINPMFSDELLDLLYEYIFTRYSNEFKEKIGTNDIKDVIDYVLDPIHYKKCEH